jgi:hypothetical protein
LILHNNLIDDRGALALARSPHLNGLASLQVSGNHIIGEGYEGLMQRFGPRVSL